MLLQTWVQLHILLSAAPALAGWMPYVHALPPVPGQAVYGVRAVPRAATLRAQNRSQALSAPAAHGLLLPCCRVCLAQGVTAPTFARRTVTRRQSVWASPHGPRAP